MLFFIGIVLVIWAICYFVYRFGAFSGHRAGYLDGYMAAVKDYKTKSQNNG
jgi:hypothetical protein